MLLINAGQIAIDSLAAQPPAIIEAFYPAFGAPAIVAQVRFRGRRGFKFDILPTSRFLRSRLRRFLERRIRGDACRIPFTRSRSPLQ